MQKKQKKPQQKSTKLKAGSLRRYKIDKPLATHQETKGEESNQQNQKWKWRKQNRKHRNIKDHKRLLSAIIC